MKILAIDPGTKCGWAYGDDTLQVTPMMNSGTWQLTSGRWHDLGSRCIRLRQEIRKIFELGVDLVVYEEVRRHLGTDAAHVYGAIVGALQEECRNAGVSFESVPVGTVKKHATGKGNANKEAMLAAAIARGWKPVDDNEADALFILDWRLKGGE
jgi:Holliday junction resolvasome RuvABC endonuclease subunit